MKILTVFLSIIVNNHNYERVFGDCIEPALAATDEDCEIIVVDHGLVRGRSAGSGPRRRIFLSELLRKTFPLPEAKWRICADNVAFSMGALYAPYEGCPEVINLYRFHGENRYFSDLLSSLATHRSIILSHEAFISNDLSLLGTRGAQVYFLRPFIWSSSSGVHAGLQ